MIKIKKCTKANCWDLYACVSVSTTRASVSVFITGKALMHLKPRLRNLHLYIVYSTT